MCKIMVYAGTTEGYELTRYLMEHRVMVHMSVATQYGGQKFPEGPYLKILKERMDEAAMEDYIRREAFHLVVDATHPYAAVVTVNIRNACEAAGIPYLRVVRGEDCYEQGENVVTVASVDEAVDYLGQTEGNVLVTTGSKELHKFTRLEDYENRIYARVLSLPEVVTQCTALGFTGKHLLCMQGPFSREWNTAMLKQYGCAYMVTKESGSNGGFLDKYEAAREAGVKLVVIGRPSQEEGLSLAEAKEYLRQRCHISVKQQITLVGVGMGSRGTLTLDGEKACRQADLIMGGRRLADAVRKPGQAVCYEYLAPEIRSYIKEHPQYENIVIALSGDVGFYSGARRLLDVLPEDTKVVCGISSLNYFMSKIGLAWDDAVLASTHGRSCNLLHYCKYNRKTFAILGKEEAVASLAGELAYYGLPNVTLYVGENLSYDNERISIGVPADFMEYKADTLSVVCVENPLPAIYNCHLRDEDFIRDKVPMTKEEIRHLSVDKLQLRADSICYDVGAGTGSVSCEMALGAHQGRVYAIEKKAAAVDLIRRNARKLALSNIAVVEGTAPEALEGLEAPTHVFIGGSSGNLRQIMEHCLKKNPHVQMVINCITLETVAEALASVKKLNVTAVDITQVTVAKSREIGNYHMMTGENPIYMISCKGGS